LKEAVLSLADTSHTHDVDANAAHEIARLPRYRRALPSADYRKQYTDPSREPTTTSPVGPMAGDESMGPSVAKDHTSVPSGATA
jgi:hypothetical protein